VTIPEPASASFAATIMALSLILRRRK
jgi:hypothetical protein